MVFVVIVQPTIGKIQNFVLSNFPGTKFRHTAKLVIGLTNTNDQVKTVTTEHNRAHRSLQKNYKQIINEYFFPKIKKLLNIKNS